MTVSDLRALLANANVRAFLRVIREKESSQTDAAYFMRWPGKTFADLSAHPNILEPIPGSTLKSSAAGAFQIVNTTWRALVDQYGFPDFSRDSQDCAAAALIAGRGALQDVLAGRFDQAVAKCRQEWTSLPGAAESRATWTMDKARAVFLQYGGTLTESAPPKLNQRKDANMLPLLAAFGPLIAELIPQVSKLFVKGERGEQNVAAATAVFDAVVKASGQPNIQAAVEAMQVDPALTKTVTAAVVTDPEIVGLLEIGGGLKAAREQDAAVTQAEKGFWYSPAFWFAVLVVMPPVDFMVAVVVWRMSPPSEQLVTQVVTGLLGLIAVAAAFYYGSAYGSQKKDVLLAEKSR